MDLDYAWPPDNEAPIYAGIPSGGRETEALVENQEVEASREHDIICVEFTE
jgi:hypothetical protein